MRDKVFGTEPFQASIADLPYALLAQATQNHCRLAYMHVLSK